MSLLFPSITAITGDHVRRPGSPASPVLARWDGMTAIALFHPQRLCRLDPAGTKRGDGAGNGSGQEKTRDRSGENRGIKFAQGFLHDMSTEQARLVASQVQDWRRDHPLSKRGLYFVVNSPPDLLISRRRRPQFRRDRPPGEREIC